MSKLLVSDVIIPCAADSQRMVILSQQSTYVIAVIPVRTAGSSINAMTPHLMSALQQQPLTISIVFGAALRTKAAIAEAAARAYGTQDVAPKLSPYEFLGTAQACIFALAGWL